MFNETEFNTKRAGIMQNLEILDSLIQMNQLQLKTLYKYKEMAASGDLADGDAQVAIEDVTSYATKRHSELSEKLIDNLRQTCF